MFALVVVIGTRSDIGSSLWQEEAAMIKVVKIKKSSFAKIFFIFYCFGDFTKLLSIYTLLTEGCTQKFHFSMPYKYEELCIY